MKRLHWVIDNKPYDLEQYFQEFYQPGLLKDVLQHRRLISEILKERGDPRALMSVADKDRRLPSLTLEVPQESNSRIITIKLHIAEAPPDSTHPSGSGVKDVRLFRNGTLVKKWEGPQVSGSTLICQLPVSEGDNTMSAYAFNNDNVKSRDVAATSKGAASLRRDAGAHILSIGIDRYSIPSMNLNYAVKDATDLADRLRDNLPIKKENIHVTLLTDEKATREGIISALHELALTAQPEDTVIISYAGHGINHERTFYFVPQDLGVKDELSLSDLVTRSISDDSFQRIILGTSGEGAKKEPGSPSGIQARHLALVIDACHSGQVLEADEWRVGPMNSRGLAQLAWEKGMEIITASQSNQFAKEVRGLNHGLLTYALLEGFARAPRKESRLTGGAWFDFAALELPRISESSKTRGLVSTAITTKEPVTKNTLYVQTPRVFHKRDDGDEWVVSGTR